MASDPLEHIREALSGGLLAGRPVRSLPTPGRGPGVLVVECRSEEVLPAWQAARDVVAHTGRWPVVSAWCDDTDVAGIALPLGRGGYGGSRDDSDPEAVCRRAELVDADVAIEAVASSSDSRRPPDWDDYVAWEIGRTRQTHGVAPTPAELQRALPRRAGTVTLDRCLFEWEQHAEAHGVVPQPPTTAHLTWFEPHDRPGVLLLPTPHPWQAPAWTPFYGAEGVGGHERLIAVLKRWHERWGAELVANWGTMLQLVVVRPPQTVRDAYPVAVAHDLLATSTLGSTNVSVREHARALIGRPTWFLHDRP